MEVSNLKQCIKHNDIPNFLIFTGDEYAIQRIYIKEIAKRKNLVVKYIDSVSDIFSTMSAKSLFSKNYLYVSIDDKEFMTTEKLYSNITNILADNILILQLTSVDKRLKILKQYKDSIVEFNALKSDILKHYIQREIALNDRNCEILMEICDYNYGHCLLEIDKINKYTEYQAKGETNVNIDMDGMFRYLLEDGTINIPPRDAVFDLVRAILNDNPIEAFELYNECKEIGEAPLVIITILYNTARQLLQVQSAKGDDVSKTTGLTPWQIKTVSQYINHFSNKELIYLLKLIQKVERGIKKGLIDDDIAIEYIISNFL